MAVIQIKQFGGVAPKVPPRYLQDSQAQVALNGPLYAGALQPLAGFGSWLLTLPKSGVIQSMYRFGQDTASDTQYWFHWTQDVDVARGPIAGDTSEKTVFTGTDFPRITDNTLGLSGGTNYPVASYRLGVPAPTTAPAVTALGAADSTALPETRVYAYTFVNSWGQESAPSPGSIPVNWTVGQTVRVNMATAPGGAWNLTHRRIYRSVAGTYLFVAQVAITTTSYTDAVSSDNVVEELPSLTWVMPPDQLRGIVAAPNGIMAGFVGNDIYFCEPFRPFAWPLGYVQTVKYPVVGLGVMDTTIAVLTKGYPYFLQGSHPDSMVLVQSDIEQACVSKRSIVSVGSSVLYASPDGLVMLSSGQSKILTEGMFSRDQWQQLNPSSIHAYSHDRGYVAFYQTTSGQQGGFLVDLVSGTFIFHDLYATAGYSDKVNDTLYLCNTNRGVRKWLAGSPKTYIWRSKKYSLPAPLSFSCAQVEAESDSLTARFYMDGVLTHTQTVTNRNPFRLPPLRGRDLEIELQGNKEVFAVAVATSMAELANV